MASSILPLSQHPETYKRDLFLTPCFILSLLLIIKYSHTIKYHLERTATCDAFQVYGKKQKQKTALP
jgi:hypothetical protein